MGFLEDAHEALGRGASAAGEAARTVAGEQLEFARAFARMCRDGCAAGFHERNGGNASYRLSADDVRSIRPLLRGDAGAWEPLGEAVPSMAGEFLLVTGSGKHLRNVSRDVAGNAGIVELGADGGTWRVRWGLAGARPTSELAAHVAAFDARPEARVLYHAHPPALVALTALVEADARTLTRILWRSLTESVIAVPGGVGALGWMVPGSPALAKATAEVLRDFTACVWQLHGIFASGGDFDEAFGLVEALEKAADVYLRARAAQGGAPELPNALSDADLRAIAAAHGLPFDASLLHAPAGGDGPFPAEAPES